MKFKSNKISCELPSLLYKAILNESPPPLVSNEKSEMDGREFLARSLLMVFWSCAQMITTWLSFPFSTIDYGYAKHS